jgi:hypothetical protein
MAGRDELSVAVARGVVILIRRMGHSAEYSQLLGYRHFHEENRKAGRDELVRRIFSYFPKFLIPFSTIFFGARVAPMKNDTEGES